MSRWWLPGGFLALLGARGWYALHPEWLTDGPILCPVRLLTGVPCPGCGMTRAVASCVLGDWMGAFHHHPLAVPLLGLAVVTALLAWCPPAWQEPWRRLWAQRWWSGALLGCVVGVWLFRVAPLPGGPLG